MRPSALSVACTAGRAATRAWNCCNAGHGLEIHLVVTRPVQDDEQVRVRDRELVAGQVRLLRQRFGDQREAIAERLHRALTDVRPVFGFHSGPKPLCTSVAMNASHSMSFQRSLVPKSGASCPGFWSAMYCRTTLLHSVVVPSSSTSNGT